jgi:hypothetical protein
MRVSSLLWKHQLVATEVLKPSFYYCSIVASERYCGTDSLSVVKMQVSTLLVWERFRGSAVPAKDLDGVHASMNGAGL